MSSNLPTGTVTFLFTDIEGSTHLWEQYPEAMKPALARHDALLRQAVESHRGVVIKTTGDGLYAAFNAAHDGVEAMIAGQRSLQAESWDSTSPLRVRMALHTGEAEERQGDYYGPALNRAARLMAVASGGQMLLSQAATALVQGQLPDQAALRDLGEQRLRDLSRPERVFQLVAPGLPADFPPLKTLTTSPNNLPIQLTSFVGREREMAELEQALRAARLLTLIGPGGTGKTRLGLQACAEALPNFPDGVWLVELAPLADPEVILPTMASIFGLRQLPGSQLREQVIDYLRAKHLLLILDNCEHLIEACARLADTLLHQCPQLKIVASSREALGITGESIFRVPSLSIPESKDFSPESLLAYEAIQLFIERAAAIQPHFAMTATNALAVSQLCRRLDGIPLALELAAARVPVFSVEQLAARLDDVFRLLTGGSRTALPRQQTLRAMIDWSYDLLSAPEQALLRRLAVFANGWTLEAAESLADDLDVLEALPQLVNKSLVILDNAEGGAARYRLLETIRQYARDRLYATGEAPQARDRHLRYFADLAEQARLGLLSPDMLTWVERLDSEFDNFRVALEWGLETDPETVLQILAGIGLQWSLQGFSAEMSHWLNTAQERVAALPPVEGQAAVRRGRLRAMGYTAAAIVAFELGGMPVSVETSRLAVQLARQHGDPRTLAFCLSWDAFIRMNYGDPGAWDVAQEALPVSQAAGEQHGVLLAFNVMSVAEFRRGNLEAARAYLASGERAARETGNPFMMAMPNFSLAMQSRLHGDFATAQRYFNHCLPLFIQQKNKHFEAVARSELGHIARLTGDPAAALETYRESILLWRDLGVRAAIANHLECFAYLARLDGGTDRALRLLGEAQALREAIGTPMADYEVPEYEQEVAALRTQVDAATFESAWAAGKTLSMEQAIELALKSTAT